MRTGSGATRLQDAAARHAAATASRMAASPSGRSDGRRHGWRRGRGPVRLSGAALCAGLRDEGVLGCGWVPGDREYQDPYDYLIALEVWWAYVIPTHAYTDKFGVVHMAHEGCTVSHCDVSRVLGMLYPQSSDEVIAFTRAQALPEDRVNCVLCIGDLIRREW